MLKRLTEFRILQYYAKRNEYIVTSEASAKLNLNADLTRDIVKSLRDKNLLTQSTIDVNGVSTSANKINGKGIAYFNKLKSERVASFVGTLIAFLGLVITLVGIFF